MTVEVSEGQAAAARQMANGAAASSEIVRVCARGQICGLSPRHLENKYLSRSQPEIPPKHRFSVDFPILEIVKTNSRLNMQCTRSYCRRILYRSRWEITVLYNRLRSYITELPAESCHSSTTIQCALQMTVFMRGEKSQAIKGLIIFINP